MTPKLGDYILWNGEIAQIISRTDRPTVGIKILEPKKCPHCENVIGNDFFDVIPESPLFLENAKPVQTMGDNTIKL
jgi:hypothetical protein